MSTEPLSFTESIEVPNQQIIYFLTELLQPDNDSNAKKQHVAITGIVFTTYLKKTVNPIPCRDLDLQNRTTT